MLYGENSLVATQHRWGSDPLLVLVMVVVLLVESGVAAAAPASA